MLLGFGHMKEGRKEGKERREKPPSINTTQWEDEWDTCGELMMMMNDDDDDGLNLFDFGEEIRLWGRISGCNEWPTKLLWQVSVHSRSLFPTPSITWKVRLKFYYTELLFFNFTQNLLYQLLNGDVVVVRKKSQLHKFAAVVCNGSCAMECKKTPDVTQ
jgi:hypothetical protein